ncbi:hypothetical protein CEXT_471691 [Caerostris extrusa]|uniref:Uncharacterized protein n=1 Tax=Caerostris extrusa TaxID=172846 RepID=A0AAV4NCV8_CAEEX|nr:hypothetical protein CEXT_471691 [Caerostris extrusa]
MKSSGKTSHRPNKMALSNLQLNRPRGWDVLFEAAFRVAGDTDISLLKQRIGEKVVIHYDPIIHVSYLRKSFHPIIYPQENRPQFCR